MTDFYQPPVSNVETPVIDDRTGPPWRGLLIGILIEFVGGILVGILLVFGHGLLLMMFGMPTDEVVAFWTEFEFYSLTSLILHGASLSMTFLGAYFCVRLINYSLYKFAVIYAVISSILGVIIDMGSLYSIDQHIVLIIATFALSLSAAWFHGYRKLQKQR